MGNEQNKGMLFHVPRNEWDVGCWDVCDSAAKAIYLHWTELSVSDKECKYFRVGMRRTCALGHSCNLLSLAYLRFDICNVSRYKLLIFQSIFIFKVHSCSKVWQFNNYIYNRGQKLLGKLRPSLHFAPNSIVRTISCTIWEMSCSCAPPPLFNVGIVHGVLHGR